MCVASGCSCCSCQPGAALCLITSESKRHPALLNRIRRCFCVQRVHFRRGSAAGVGCAAICCRWSSHTVRRAVCCGETVTTSEFCVVCTLLVVSGKLALFFAGGCQSRRVLLPGCLQQGAGSLSCIKIVALLWRYDWWQHKQQMRRSLNTVHPNSAARLAGATHHGACILYHAAAAAIRKVPKQIGTQTERPVGWSRRPQQAPVNLGSIRSAASHQRSSAGPTRKHKQMSRLGSTFRLHRTSFGAVSSKP